jgi:hypothetical protein
MLKKLTQGERVRKEQKLKRRSASELIFCVPSEKFDFEINERPLNVIALKLPLNVITLKLPLNVIA